MIYNDIYDMVWYSIDYNLYFTNDFSYMDDSLRTNSYCCSYDLPGVTE